MKKIIVILIWITICSAIDERTHHRVKRKVLFTKNSKLFFRLNGKDNVIPWTQIFAHGWAFRINWELPETLPKRHKFFKREAYSDYEDLTKIQGYSCVLKHICEFIYQIKESSKCGVFCQIGKIMARSQGVDTEFFQTIFEKCEYYIENCSYSLRDTSLLLNDI